jgi:hypothetical protein
LTDLPIFEKISAKPTSDSKHPWEKEICYYFVRLEATEAIKKKQPIFNKPYFLYNLYYTAGCKWPLFNPKLFSSVATHYSCYTRVGRSGLISFKSQVTGYTQCLFINNDCTFHKAINNICSA